MCRRQNRGAGDGSQQIYQSVASSYPTLGFESLWFSSLEFIQLRSCCWHKTGNCNGISKYTAGPDCLVNGDVGVLQFAGRRFDFLFAFQERILWCYPDSPE